MTRDEILAKADAALEILIKYDEQNQDCSFKKVLLEIVEKWRDFKKVREVNGLRTHLTNSLQPSQEVT